MIIQVPPCGPKDAKIVLVGEAPGETEERRGKPFCGASGNLLDQMLHRSSILRQECYITNVIKERPASNDVSYFIRLTKKGVETTPEFWEYHRYLMAELRELSPNVIVPLGNSALYSLTGEWGITNWRGSIIKGRPDLGNVKVIPCIHPAAALRNYIYQYFIWFDLNRVKEESTFPEFRLPERRYIIRPSFSETIEFLEKMDDVSKPLSFDIETSHSMTTCIAFSNCKDEAISIPFIERLEDYFTSEEEKKIWSSISYLLENRAITKVAQNANYDCTILNMELGIRTWPCEDTMVAHKILYPDFPAGLDFLASTLTKEPYYKEEGKEGKKNNAKIANWDEFWTYNAKDAAVTLEVWENIQVKLAKQGNFDTYRQQVSLIPPLMYMQEKGILIDVTGLRKESEALQILLEKTQKRLDEFVGSKLNANSPKQMKEYFYEKKGLTPYKKRGGGITTDDDALKRIIRKGFPEAKLCQEIRSIRKLKGTYIDMTLDPDNRMRCFFRPTGTTTGRLSSKESLRDTGTNSQNQPDAMKKFWCVDEGCIGFAPDLERAENVCVAYMAPEPNMIRAFENGIDVHKQTYGMMFNIPTEEVSDEPGSSEIGDGKRSQRSWGKEFNHALNYGLGYKTFALRCELTESEARKYVELYHRVYPGIRGNFHNWIKAQLTKDRTLVNPYGRKRLFRDRFSTQMFTDAYAFMAQSTVADKIRDDGLLFMWNNKEMAQVQLLNQIHDSLLFQIPVTNGWEYISNCVHLLKKSLETPITWKETTFVIKAEMVCGLRFGKKNLVKLQDISPENLERTYNKLREKENG